MKTVLYFLSLLVATTCTGPVYDTVSKYPRFIEFPDDEGVLHQVDLAEDPDMKILDELERNPNNNEYYLFTRRNPTTPQRLTENIDSIISSNYNPRNPTVVSVHGFGGNLNTNNNLVIRDAYLNNGDVNVIVLDWRQLASESYVTAVTGIPAVGRRLGQFLSSISDLTGARLNTFHIIGFSLGAHVVGNAGRQLNGKAARVTGLDPAGPLWNMNPNRISADDAVYVEAIHTDAGPNGVGIGFLTTVGDVDFFPNGGVTQPGCSSSQCDHNRAWQQFAASVIYDHLTGRQCFDAGELITDSCSGDYLNMGNSNLNKWGFGIFRVNTGSEHPF